MKKYIIYTFLTAFSFTMLSCGADDEQKSADDDRVPIVPRAAVATLTADASEGFTTRASQNMQDTYLAVGEIVNVFIDENVPENGTMAGNYGTGAVKFRITGDGTAEGYYGMRPTALSYPYYPTNNNTINLYGFYPEEVLRNTTEFYVKSDQSGDLNYRASDLMYSNNIKEQRKTSEAIQMEFSHMLSKINIDMTYGSGTNEEKAKLEGTSVTLMNLSLGINFYAAEDEFVLKNVISGSKGEITVTKNARYESSCILPPQKVIASNFMKIRTGGGDILNFRLPQTMEFKSGWEYTFKINVTQDNIKLENFSTQPWAVDDANVPSDTNLQFVN